MFGYVPYVLVIETVYVVWMGNERYPKMTWQARTWRRRPKGRPWYTWEEGIQNILEERGIEWKGVRAIAW